MWPSVGPELITQISDDRQIDRQHRQFDPGIAAGQLEELHRDVDAAAQGSEPCRPTLPMPQAERFDEPDDDEKKRRKGEEPELGVGDAGGGVEEDAGVMPGGIHMEVPDEFFRRVVETAMDEGEEPEARYEDQPSLGPLEDGNHPKAALPGLSGYPIHRAMPNAAAAATPPMPTVWRPPISGLIPVRRAFTAPNAKSARSVTAAETASPLSTLPVVI